MKPLPSEAHFYDEYYFRHGCGRPYARTPEWLQFFAGIAEKIVREIGPGTVLDAGCAMGLLVEALRDRGVEAFGIDISEYAIQQVRENLRPYCQVGSVVAPLPRSYDLIVCIEVLEHLPPQDGERTIANFCAASADILFSSTPLDYREATHFNVQPPEHWAGLFAMHEFVRDVDFDASFITPWAVRFRRRQEPWPRAVRDYERRFGFLWKENQDLRSLAVEMRDQLSAGEQTSLALTAQLTEKEQAARALQTRLTEKEEAVHRLQTRLDEITSSPSWKLARRLRLALAPVGSRRERLLDRAFRSLLRNRGH